MLQYKASEFNCTDPTDGLEPEPRKNKTEKVVEHHYPINETKEVVPVPCWYVVGPLGLIILIIGGACLFHSVTAFITYMKTKSKPAAK